MLTFVQLLKPGSSHLTPLKIPTFYSLVTRAKSVNSALKARAKATDGL